MLFTKKIEKITFEDVITFCNEQIKESINLDYKKDFPKDLEKTISAFANTAGGLIIIGVDEDNANKPKLPVEGLEHKKGLSERVTNIIVSNIYPPVFPEIHVCDPVNGKTFVVIRVPQSDMTPHYIRHRTKVYIRTGDISSPEKLATAERIEWIRKRRKKAINFKNFLLDEARERYDNYVSINQQLGYLSAYQELGIQFAEATISSIPLYPEKGHKSLKEIKEIIRDIRVFGYKGGYGVPEMPYSRMRPVQEGFSYFDYSKNGTEYILYEELNQFGLFYRKESIGIETMNEKGEIIRKLNFIDVVKMIDLFIESAGKFYRKLGFYGLIEFKFSLSKILEIEIIRGAKPLGGEKNISIDNELEWKRGYYVNDFISERPEVLAELIKSIGWGLGDDSITDEVIKNILKKMVD
jgi:hypothetical protein